MGQVYAYAFVAVILMAATFACGYILATEQAYDKEDVAIDYDYFKQWCWEKRYTKEQQLAVFEALYEALKRLA